MSKLLKDICDLILHSFIFLNILMLILIIVNLIPNSAIYANLCNSLDYYKNMKSFTETGAEPGADLNFLNVVMHVDNKHPIYSTLVDPIYGETGKFRDDINGYESIQDKKPADNDYSRYWHGFQIVVRPLLILFNTRQIMIILSIMYVCLLILTLYRLVKLHDTVFAIGLIIIQFFGIVPNSFYVLNFIPIFFITLISVYIISYNKLNEIALFVYIGICTAFFDFLTVETLPLTIPLLYSIYRNSKTKEVKILTFVKYGVSWLCGYCFTFIYKWSLASLIYKKNFFNVALQQATKYLSTFNRLMSIKINTNALLFGKVSYNTSFYIIIVTFIILMLVFFLFRKQGTEKTLFCIFVVCLIPYVRYLVMPGHSWEHAYFQYKAQLVVIPAILVSVEIGMSYLFNNKKHKLGGSECQQ